MRHFSAIADLLSINSTGKLRWNGTNKGSEWTQKRTFSLERGGSGIKSWPLTVSLAEMEVLMVNSICKSISIPFFSSNTHLIHSFSFQFFSFSLSLFLVSSNTVLSLFLSPVISCNELRGDQSPSRRCLWGISEVASCSLASE